MTDHLPCLRLVDRLRGIYTIPVNDGAGPLDGKNTFTRRFNTSRIQHEAADWIEHAERLLAQIAASPDRADISTIAADVLRDRPADLLQQLEQPIDPNGWAKEPFVPPIHMEAIRHIKSLLAVFEKFASG